jgi:microsomal prostaglandin-E synthase 2
VSGRNTKNGSSSRRWRSNIVAAGRIPQQAPALLPPPPSQFRQRSAFSTTAVTSSVSSSPSSASSLTLYQYAICPFCNKVKALLDYTNQDYSVVEVNPLTKSELKQLEDKTYKKVPILTISTNTNDDNDNNDDHLQKRQQQFNGSDEIMKQILLLLLQEESSSSDKNNHHHHHHNEALPFLLPSSSSSSLEQFTSSPSAIRWTTFANEELAPLLYPNLCNTLSNSYQAFSYVDKVSEFSTVQKFSIRTIGSLAMYMAASKVKSTYIL